MLWTVSIVLIVLWVTGVISNYTMNGYIHILLILAITIVLVRLIQGRKVIQ